MSSNTYEIESILKTVIPELDYMFHLEGNLYVCVKEDGSYDIYDNKNHEILVQNVTLEDWNKCLLKCSIMEIGSKFLGDEIVINIESGKIVLDKTRSNIVITNDFIVVKNTTNYKSGIYDKHGNILLEFYERDKKLNYDKINIIECNNYSLVIIDVTYVAEIRTSKEYGVDFDFVGSTIIKVEDNKAKLLADTVPLRLIYIGNNKLLRVEVDKEYYEAYMRDIERSYIDYRSVKDGIIDVDMLCESNNILKELYG